MRCGCSRPISKWRCAAAARHRWRKSGSLTLPAKKLYEIVKALPETDVRIEEDKNGVKVAADRFDSRMQTLPREDFPTLPDASGKARATLPRDALQEMVAKTQFAITGEDTRYLPERREVRAEAGQPHARRHRRPSPGAGRSQARGRRHPGDRRDPAEEDAARARQAARRRRRRHPVRERREPSVLRGGRPHADLADDRRPVSGLRARHPEGQRQDDRVRSRAADQRRQARGAAVERAVARGEVRDRQGQGRGHVEQFRVRRGARAAAGGLHRRRRWRSRSTRSTCSTSSTSSRPTSCRSRSRTKSARP